MMYALTDYVLTVDKTLKSCVVWQAAKKEMELQRQMEWEQQRHTQLDVLKVKEKGVVDRLDREVSKLKSDLATLVCFIVLKSFNISFDVSL